MKKKLIPLCIAAVLFAVCSDATDNFTRGYVFDGETGQKTGSDLEDLVTQATLNRNDSGTNRIYDNVTINLDSSSNPRLQIKDYGVSSTKIATGGVASVNILDGTIETNDLSTNVIAYINTSAGLVPYINSYATNEIRRFTNGVLISGWAYGQGTTNSDCWINVPFNYTFSNKPYVVCMNHYLNTTPPQWTNESDSGTGSGFNFVHLQQISRTNINVLIQYRTSAFAKQNMTNWYFGLNYIATGE